MCPFVFITYDLCVNWWTESDGERMKRGGEERDWVLLVWWSLCVIFSGFCHPAKPSVFVTLHTLIRPAALAFIPQLITVPAFTHTSGSWQEASTLPQHPSLFVYLPSFLSSNLSFFITLYFLFFLPGLSLYFLLLLFPSKCSSDCLPSSSRSLFLCSVPPSSFSTSVSLPSFSCPPSPYCSLISLFPQLLYCLFIFLLSSPSLHPSRPCRRYRGSLMQLSTSSSWCCNSRSTTLSCRTWPLCNR